MVETKQKIMMQKCSACGEEKTESDYYQYKTGRLYKRCKKCHNKTRGPRKPRVLETPRLDVLTVMLPDGTIKTYPNPFGLISAASEALANSTTGTATINIVEPSQNVGSASTHSVEDTPHPDA